MRALFILLFMLNGLLFGAAEFKFLGVFTAGTYPVSNCKVIKAHDNLLVMELSGNYNQYVDQKKRNYLSDISQFPLKEKLIQRAKDLGYNAILGYQYYVKGGYSGFDGKVIDGSIGIGAYRAGVMGNPVLINCRHIVW